MKFLILIVAFTLTTSAFGQNIKNQTRVFLDSTLIEEYFLFDPLKIDNIFIGKGFDSLNSPKGAIYIKSKNKLDYNFLSLSDVKKLNNINKRTTVIFMLNDKFLTDHITNYKIDSSYILKVQIKKLKEFDYIKKKYKDITIINLLTRTKANIEAEKIIRIR